MNIVIVDDVSLIRVGLAHILTSAGYFVAGEAENAEEAVRVILQANPDLILLDYHLVDSTGLEVYGIIQSSRLKAKVILLTGAEDIRLLAKIIFHTDICAVVKKGDNSELLHIIEQVSLGKIYIDPLIFSDVLQYKRIVNGLTAKQEEILYWLLQGLTNEQIAEKVNISVRALSNQRTAIRKCINQHKLNSLQKIFVGKFNRQVKLH